jgi:hypothetical protein
LLSLDGEEWASRAVDDLTNPALNLSDGRWLSYDQLLAEVGEPYSEAAAPAEFRRKSDAAQAALDRLADEIERAEPDVILIVGDDQDELYTAGSMPAIALYYGDEIVTHQHSLLTRAQVPTWAAKVTKGWAVDRVHRFPGARTFALELIAGLLANEIDIAVCGEVADPEKAGFGHAYGFVITRLLRRPTPVVPILLNTYFPPNVLSPGRCVEIGRALRRAIEASPSPLRVAVVASGGLSHFVVDEELDQKVLAALRDGEPSRLADLPRGALNSGSSEILNWVLMGGAIEHLPFKWLDYLAVQRTPAGTGVGVAFAAWGSAAAGPEARPQL